MGASSAGRSIWVREAFELLVRRICGSGASYKIQDPFSTLRGFHHGEEHPGEIGSGQSTGDDDLVELLAQFGSPA